MLEVYISKTAGGLKIKCSDTTFNAWGVPFPAIWEAFLAKFFYYSSA